MRNLQTLLERQVAAAGRPSPKLIVGAGHNCAALLRLDELCQIRHIAESLVCDGE